MRDEKTAICFFLTMCGIATELTYTKQKADFPIRYRSTGMVDIKFRAVDGFVPVCHLISSWRKPMNGGMRHGKLCGSVPM